MAEPRHLPKAPIKEAVLDFRLQLPSDFSVERFLEAEPQIGYESRRNLASFEMSVVQIADGSPPQTSQKDYGLIGYRFDSKDGRNIVQFRKDGFTFSRLTPYTDWESVMGEVSRLYEIYFGIASPRECSRIGVRYINTLPLPREEILDFSPFLTAKPPVPNCQPQYLTGFLTQVQLRERDFQGNATITQYVQEDGSPDIVPVILDIEVFEAGSFRAIASDILLKLKPLRELKNRYFFASITERAAQLFE